jgi:hypothetical protein
MCECKKHQPKWLICENEKTQAQEANWKILKTKYLILFSTFYHVTNSAN